MVFIPCRRVRASHGAMTISPMPTRKNVMMNVCASFERYRIVAAIAVRHTALINIQLVPRTGPDRPANRLAMEPMGAGVFMASFSGHGGTPFVPRRRMSRRSPRRRQSSRHRAAPKK